jgi:hypothetical protein
MNKVNTSVFKLVNEVLKLVSEEHDIPFEKLQETSRKIVEPVSRTRCTGIVYKTGTRCCTSLSVLNTEFCRRHTPIDGIESTCPSEVSSKQCESMTNNGTRCVRNVKENGLCGVHILKQNVYDCRQIAEYKCVHYEEDNGDGNDTVLCNKSISSKNNGWFCKRHQHLQSLYAKQYGYSNAEQYVSSIKNGSCTKRNVFLDNIFQI